MMNKKTFTLWIVCCLSLFLFTLNSCSYTASFDSDIIKAECGNSVTLSNDGDTIVVSPVAGSNTAIIFYPGALVNYESYLLLFIKCAKYGIKTFIIQMPADFAFLYSEAAGRIRVRYADEISNWYICGHSLGGAMGANYLASNPNSFKGIIFLASFSTSDLNGKNLSALSIYGSLDGVLNRNSYEKYKSNLPSGYTEVVIPGGNHAGFANYGSQKGDNEATISADSQQNITASAIRDFVF